MKSKRVFFIIIILLSLLVTLLLLFRTVRTKYIVSQYFYNVQWLAKKKFHSYYKKKMPVTILFGNSITENFKQYLPESDSLLNMGISGDFTEGLLRRLANVTDLKPEKLFIKIGINDIVERVPLQEIESNYKEILGRITKESPATIIYIQSTLPTRDLKSIFRDSKDINKIVMELNVFLKEQAKERNLTFIDMYPDFADANNELRKEFTYDGVHLTEQGYIVWKKYLSKYISI